MMVVLIVAFTPHVGFKGSEDDRRQECSDLGWLVGSLEHVCSLCVCPSAAKKAPRLEIMQMRIRVVCESK